MTDHTHDFRKRPSLTPPDNSTASDPLDSIVQAHIGRELRALFDGIATEPVPDRFVQLLQKLDQQRGGPAASKEDRA